MMSRGIGLMVELPLSQASRNGLRAQSLIAEFSLLLVRLESASLPCLPALSPQVTLSWLSNYPLADRWVRAPLRSVACAVHVKGKTAIEVAQ